MICNTRGPSPRFLVGNRFEDMRNSIHFNTNIRDLVVVIDQDLKFHEHTSLVTNKANRVLGLIKSGFAYLDSNMLVHL